MWCPAPAAGGRGRVQGHHHRQPDQLPALRYQGDEQERCRRHLPSQEKRYGRDHCNDSVYVFETNGLCIKGKPNATPHPFHVVGKLVWQVCLLSLTMSGEGWPQPWLSPPAAARLRGEREEGSQKAKLQLSGVQCSYAIARFADNLSPC